MNATLGGASGGLASCRPAQGRETSPRIPRTAARDRCPVARLQSSATSRLLFQCSRQQQRRARMSQPYAAQAGSAVVAPPPAEPAGVTGAFGLERGPDGLERIKYQDKGYEFWQWQDVETGSHRVHYISAGLENNQKGPTILLVHGFGASAYHWRSNIPALVRAGYRVYAVCLLGFGWSDKAAVSYDDYSIWQRQLRDFVRDVVKDRVVVAGNSLGGYNSLSLAASNPELVAGVALLNGAGRFDDLDAPAAQQAADVVELDPLAALGQPVQAPPSPLTTPPAPSFLQRLAAAPKELATRVSLYVAFIYAKQPGRVRQVLNKVYIDTTNVDDDLVTSILQPAQNARAAEVFRLILSGTGVSINKLLRGMSTPLLLLWGDKDPWIGPRSADRVMSLYPDSVRIRLDAGHCPHDEAPKATNEGLLSWLATLDKHTEL